MPGLDDYADALRLRNGRADVPAVRRPRVAVMSTGDEIIAPGERPQTAAVYDGRIRVPVRGALEPWRQQDDLASGVVDIGDVRPVAAADGTPERESV